ncbi:MAG: ERF family protein [Candidatus Omnitrophica bacterium]|nr:ERF family protein [Candidatus Omnitrophota bacterium]MDE2232447.1 ERF family protein [Candidatus Omnitrophota bacterium]
MTAALEPQEPGPGWLKVIDRIVEKGNCDSTVLTNLFNMQKEWEQERARKEFVAAFAAFKAEAPAAIERTGHVSFTGAKGTVEYDHAELDQAAKSIIPVLSKYHLGHSWETDQAENGMVTVTCRLEHAGGYSRKISLRAMPDLSGSKNPIQAIGSTVYYLERYTFLAILGIAQGGDDDGKYGGDTYISPDKIGEINGLIEQIEQAGGKLDFSKFLAFAFDCDVKDLTDDHRLELLPVKRGELAISMLRDKLANVKKGKK